MQKSRLVACLLIFCSFFSYTAYGQKAGRSSQASTTRDLSFDERLVLHAIRTLHSAQMAYAWTYGSGNYAATLLALQQAALIDDSLATGQKFGYNFAMTRRLATSTVMPGFEVTAVPVDPQERKFSFYMNDSCDIHGSLRSHGLPSMSLPVIEPCGTSLRSLNEAVAVSSLRNIYNAEITYRMYIGAGSFGTVDQLYNANLITPRPAYGSLWRGYVSRLLLVNGSGVPSFEYTSTPQEYGRTGVRSFFIDQTGVLRGADKQGGPADRNDPPISN